MSQETKHDKLDHLLLLQEAWYSDRPSLNDQNNVYMLFALLAREMGEAAKEWERTKDPEKTGRELADIGWFLFALFRQLDVDIHEAMVEKIAYNIYRYEWRMFGPEDDFYESRIKVKQMQPQKHREFYGETED